MDCLLTLLERYPFPVQKESNPMLLTYTCFTDRNTAKALEIQHHGYRYIVRKQDQQILVLIIVDPQLEAKEGISVLFVPYNILKRFNQKNPKVTVLRKQILMTTPMLPRLTEAKQINVYFNSSFKVDPAFIAMLSAGSHVVKTGEHYFQSLWLSSYLNKFRNLQNQLEWSLLIKEQQKGQTKNYFRCYMEVVDEQVPKKYFLFKNGVTKLNIKQIDLHPYNLYQTIMVDDVCQEIFKLQAYAGLVNVFKEKTNGSSIILLQAQKDIGLPFFLQDMSQNVLNLNFHCIDCNLLSSYQQFERRLAWLSNLQDSVVLIRNLQWIEQLYQADQILNVQMKHIVKKIEEAFVNLQKVTPRKYLFVVESQGVGVTESMFQNCQKLAIDMDKTVKAYIFQLIFNQLDKSYNHKDQIVQICHDKFGWEKFKTFLETEWERVSTKEVGDILKEISKLIKQQEVQNLIQVSWDDVGGLEAAKEEIIQTILLPIKHPQIFDQWIKPRTGLLFYGPPGTGKTLLGKCIAKECKMSFISVKGPELLNMYVGQSQKNVRQVFQRAAACKPCIVFMDELDALIPKRGNNSDSHQVMDRIVAELLVQMDIASANQVFIIGATNRPDLLDPSIMRPGRFDKQIYLGITKNKQDRIKILKAQTRQLTLQEGINWEGLLEKIPENFTGADFYGLTSKAVMVAAERTIQQFERGIQHQKIKISEQDFILAAEKVKPSVNEAELHRYEQLKKIYS